MFLSVAAEREIVNYTQMLFPWFTHSPLSAAAILFGGAMVAVLLYTYVYDYRMRPEGKMAGTTPAPEAKASPAGVGRP